MLSVRPSRVRLVMMVLVGALLVANGTASAQAEISRPTPALFEGDVVDLTRGWGGAVACLVIPSGVECFRSIEELEMREQLLLQPDRVLETSVAQEGGVVLATCSTPLRLYDGTYLTGSVLSIATRGLWINLSTYGFDNMTSSYLVGACAVELASGINGGGSRYPQCLYAFCQENVMLAGWDNALSSAYLK